MAWALVQAPTPTSGDPSATSIALAYGSSVTSGNLLVAVGGWSNATAEDATVTDTLGTTWSRVQTPGTWDTTGQYGIQVFYGLAPSSGANTATLGNFGGVSGSRAFRELAVFEFSGNASSSVLDTSKFTANVTGNSTANAMTSGTTSTAGSGELIFGVLQATRSGAFLSMAAGTGFTEAKKLPGYGLDTEYQTQPSAGSIAATFTIGASVNTWIVGFAAFKPAGAGGGSVSAVAATATAQIPTSGGVPEVDVDLTYNVSD